MDVNEMIKNVKIKQVGEILEFKNRRVNGALDSVNSRLVNSPKNKKEAISFIKETLQGCKRDGIINGFSGLRMSNNSLFLEINIGGLITTVSVSL